MEDTSFVRQLFGWAVMKTVDSAIYWRMNSPSTFVREFSQTLNDSRVVIVNTPTPVMAAVQLGVDMGLEHARISKVYRLAVRAGTDIAADLAKHFEGTRITSSILASYHNGFPNVVVLNALDIEGQDHCEIYFDGFLNTVGTSLDAGDVKLVVFLHSNQYKENFYLKGQPLRLLTFDGGLKKEELNAYVLLRMAGKTGPGSTNLIQHLVCEFSGYDAEFAEELIGMDSEQLVHIPQYLSLLYQKDPEKWRSNSWVDGVSSSASLEPHVLRDHYLTQHGKPAERRPAQRRIAQRYWRACLQAITPWLEERRWSVVGHFEQQLKSSCKPGSETHIEIPAGNRTMDIHYSDLEYNNVCGLKKAGKLQLRSEEDHKYFSICRLASNVRNEIAHLRSPNNRELQTLIKEMDVILG